MSLGNAKASVIQITYSGGSTPCWTLGWPTCPIQFSSWPWVYLPALSSSPPDPGLTYLPYPVLLLTLGLPTCSILFSGPWVDLPSLSSSPPDPGFTYLLYPVLLRTLGWPTCSILFSSSPWVDLPALSYYEVQSNKHEEG